ncbi:MAG TPA: NADH-quinone oxidoreductase subunit D [Candidatus Binatia bacterium]|nr:NADH-quinone oxidoreductase subunit D [Candidatus Binatia bacterium]
MSVEVEFAEGGEAFGTEEMTLNMGPQHPSTHGVLRFIVKADGEVMRAAVPDIGYLHRSLEKIAEKVGWHGFMPYTDRVDYVAAMTTNQAWAMAGEALGGIVVPRRGEYCRIIACELGRICSHLLAVGAMGMDIGAITPFTHAIRERELINDLLEELCGSRLTFNYMRIGGVAWDLPPGYATKVRRFLDHFEPIVDEFDDLLSHNKIYVERLANVAVVTREMAIAYNLVGPNLRASGVPYDLRKNRPYSVYSDFEFDVPVGQGFHGTVGDCWDRYAVRIEEMRQSARILRQAVEGLPEGPVIAKVPRNFKPAAGEFHSRVETARGDQSWYVVSDGSEYPYRVHIRTGSFSAMSIVDALARGLMIADLIAVIASFDIVAPEVDR